MATGTPRLPSSYPETPAPSVRQRRAPSPVRQPQLPQPSFQARYAAASSTKPGTPPSVLQTPPPLQPLISTDVVDAPTQRLYAVAIFMLLQAWKLYDIARLYAAEGDSISELWFCMKWLVMDGCFFWFLPLLRIPWLTFTPTFTLIAIAALSVVDIIVSLKYQLPITAFFAAIWKRMYPLSRRLLRWLCADLLPIQSFTTESCRYPREASSGTIS